MSKKLRLPKNPVPGLSHLSFTSWWTEQGTKRYVEIVFDMHEKLFKVTLDAKVARLQNDVTDSLRELTKPDKTQVSMKLHERMLGGASLTSLGPAKSVPHQLPPLDEWDLHLGVRLKILGRPTTLMQADLQTTEWLEYQSTRLKIILKEYIDNLSKYETVATDLPARMASFSASPSRGKGRTDLRATLNLIDDCHVRLSRYRPSVAQGLYAHVRQLQNVTADPGAVLEE